MTLFPRGFHPHGRSETRFVEVFTAGKPIVFTLHGYQRAIHEIVHGHVDRFYVRGRGPEPHRLAHVHRGRQLDPVAAQVSKLFVSER